MKRWEAIRAFEAGERVTHSYFMACIRDKLDLEALLMNKRELDDGWEILSPKQWEVTAYCTTRYTMTIEANTAMEATELAKGHECISGEWQEDFDFFEFNITDTQEVEEE